MFMIRVLFVLSVALVDDEDHYCGVWSESAGW